MLTTALRRRLLPNLRNATWSYREELQRHTTGARWLDLGCGHALLPPWMPDAESAACELTSRAESVIGIDRDAAAVKAHATLTRRVVGTIDALPLPDASVDLVTANMVLEHVADPDGVWKEIARVLVLGGHCIVHTPNRRFYQIRASQVVPRWLRTRAAAVIEKRSSEDVYPTYYRCNTVDDLSRGAERHGLLLQRVIATHSGLLLKNWGWLAIPEILMLWGIERLNGERSNLIAVLVKPHSRPE